MRSTVKVLKEVLKKHQQNIADWQQVITEFGGTDKQSDKQFAAGVDQIGREAMANALRTELEAAFAEELI
jgi:hypothetical protein